MATRALTGSMVPRMQPRIVDQRSEPRHQSEVEDAVLMFRGAPYPIGVINISTRGAMVECDLQPRLGESVMVRFDGCSPIYAFVRWVREGRLGLNFGGELTIG